MSSVSTLQGTFDNSSPRFWKTPPNKLRLEFFVNSLDVRIRRIRNVSEDDERMHVISELQNELIKLRNTIQNRFDEIQSMSRLSHLMRSANSDGICADLWNEAYRLQQLIAIAEPPDTLFLELERITNQSIAEHIPGAERLKKTLCEVEKDLMDTTPCCPEKRILKAGAEINVRMHLLDALEQLNLYMQRKFLSRYFQKQTIDRMIFVGIFSLLMFILPYAYLYAKINLNQSYPQQLYWAWLPGYSAMFSGLFGAIFSQLIFLHQTCVKSLSLGKIADARRWATILLRGIVGMCGAVIVYFFLQSGIISGSVIPDFHDVGIHSFTWPGTVQGHSDSSDNPIMWCIVLPDRALALLVVWCFLAGFSERLVPNILTSTEKKMTAAAQT